MVRGLAAVALAATLASAPLRAAPAACPPCEHLNQQLETARNQVADLEKQRADLDAADAADDRRTPEIDAEIQRQANTSMSGPQPDGSTLSSRYDLASGEIVTTRTPPGGGNAEVVSQTPSPYLQRLLTERDALAQKKADAKAERATNAAELAAAQAKVAELAAALADCIAKHCTPKIPTTELVLDGVLHKEFLIAAGENPNDVVAGMTGATLFAIPQGGYQVSVPVPTDPIAANAFEQRLAQLVKDGKISNLQDEPCRKFLPFAESMFAHEGVLVATGTPVEIMKGTARTSDGAGVGTAIVLLFPQPPPVADAPEEDDDKAEGWIPGQDDQPPATGIPTMTGDFVIVVPGGYTGPFILALGIYCHCDHSTSQTNAGTSTATRGPKATAETAGSSGVTVSGGGTPPPAGGGGGTQERPKPDTPETQTRDGDEEPPDDPRDQPTADDPRDLPEEDPCFCGPTMDQAMTDTLNRLRERVDKLPGSEKGTWDGPWFMNENAGSFDTKPAPLRDPKAPADASGDGSSWMCPSPKCQVFRGANGFGSMTAKVCGYCLPYHMFNEINAAFVSSGVDVPLVVHVGGANVQEFINNKGNIEGNAPFIAYRVGYDLEAATQTVGALTPAQYCKILDDRMKRVLPKSQLGPATMPSLSTGTASNWDLINAEYPGLGQCKDCPDQAPGRFTKDFSKQMWKLEDGTAVGEEYGNQGGEDP